jgi:hypothetical protein
MDPCIFYQINTDEKTRKVTGYLIVMTWVDDCRYFGTPELVRKYEETISGNCKCTMEGETKEFVSIQVKHDIIYRQSKDTLIDYLNTFI